MARYHPHFEAAAPILDVSELAHTNVVDPASLERAGAPPDRLSPHRWDEVPDRDQVIRVFGGRWPSNKAGHSDTTALSKRLAAQRAQLALNRIALQELVNGAFLNVSRRLTAGCLDVHGVGRYVRGMGVGLESAGLSQNITRLLDLRESAVSFFLAGSVVAVGDGYVRRSAASCFLIEAREGAQP